MAKKTRSDIIKETILPKCPGWEEIFARNNLIKVLEQEDFLSNKDKHTLNLLKRQKLSDGFFCSRRLLEQTGTEVTTEKIIELLGISGLRLDGQEEQRIAEWVDHYQQLTLPPMTQEQKKDRDKSTTPDGMKLIITDYGEGYFEAHLEADLELTARGTLENLISRIGLLTEIKDIKRKTFPGKYGQGEKKIEIDFIIDGLAKFKGLEEERIIQIMLYKQLRESLKEKIVAIEKEKRYDTSNLRGEINFYTHLGFQELYKRILRLTDLSYFLKEIYGLIEVGTQVSKKILSKLYNVDEEKTKATRIQILSNKKTRPLAANRHALMYILRNRFKELSSTDIATILGRPESPKNHATVLLAQKEFERRPGISPRSYPKEEYSAEDLYNDAIKKHRAHILKKHRQN
jgi:hypothetical protein